MNQIETDVKKFIAKLLRDRIPYETLDIKDSLQEIGLDSLAMIELVNEIETTFRIPISDEDLLNQEEWMQTVGSVIAFIETRNKKGDEVTM